MEYIILGILILILILLIVLIFKKNNNKDEIEKISKLEISMIKEFGNFKSDFSHSISDDFNKQSDRIDKKLDYIDNKVNSRLDENFEKTNKTFTNVLERLSK